MNEKELIYLCRQFANMFGFPVRLYKNSEKIYSFLTVNLSVDPIVLCIDEIFNEKTDISYYSDRNNFYYGIVTYNEYKFVTGPVSELRQNENELKKLARILKIEKEKISEFVLEISTLSGIHLDTLLQSLILFNFTVNKTMYDISDIRIKDKEQQTLSSQIKTEEFNSGKDVYSNNARTISIEKDIIKKVMKGDVEGLIDGASKVPSVSSGNFSPQLLRHQKNFFIKLMTIVSRSSIEAGLDIDEVISAEEMYINKCETLDNPERIKNLQYHMIIDFADRVRKHLQYNSSNSKLVNEITKYIRCNRSEPIKTSDIADFLGKNRVALTTEFKNKTGMNLSDYINLKKIEEAQELLLETDISLVAISDFLGFSSQSHFCKVFKKITGVTPTEYRKIKC